MPHPLTLFSLEPIGDRAEDVVKHPSNQHLVSTVEGQIVLDIGRVRSMAGDATLATLGRNGDVFVEGSSISRTQCSFEIDRSSGIVMFYDRSHNGTSQVYGTNATPFQNGRPRKAVIQQDANTIIGMGGVGRNLVRFALIWHPSDDAELVALVKGRETATLEENPRLARTMDEADTVLPSRRETRVHTPGFRQPEMRYRIRNKMLGEGKFGTVHEAVDMDTGKLMAAKVLTPPEEGSDEWRKFKFRLKREVEHLARISHPHIVDYITSVDWEGPNPTIFMGLKQGTLTKLINGECSTNINTLSTSVFHHMLQALDYLASEGLVHRDVKPDNILYVLEQGQYHFQLGDFGLGTFATMAATFAGTPIFMAPEIIAGSSQTHKVDVWSLFVTLLWALDAGGFREASKGFRTFPQTQNAVLNIASTVQAVASISEMARIDPEERASAAQMLVKCFGGEGLSTPVAKVTPPSTSPTRADSKTSATPRARNPSSRRNANPVADQLRVKKAQPLQVRSQKDRLVRPSSVNDGEAKTRLRGGKHG